MERKDIWCGESEQKREVKRDVLVKEEQHYIPSTGQVSLRLTYQIWLLLSWLASRNLCPEGSTSSKANLQIFKGKKATFCSTEILNAFFAGSGRSCLSSNFHNLRTYNSWFLSFPQSSMVFKWFVTISLLYFSWPLRSFLCHCTESKNWANVKLQLNFFADYFQNCLSEPITAFLTKLDSCRFQVFDSDWQSNAITIK